MRLATLVADFARKTRTNSGWMHVSGPNIQDPINFGNNMGKNISAENLETTLLAFR